MPNHLEHAVIYLAGDSTVQSYSQDYAPQAGWGQFIANYFSSNVTFHNHAIGGRSSKSFVEEGRLERILEAIAADEYLFIQMGHNDSTYSKPERYTEPFSTYKQYLKQYVTGARSRGAVPLLITPVGRLHYEDGQFQNDFSDYCLAMKQVASELDVTLIDLMSKSLAYYDTIGFEQAQKLFMVSVNGTDHTHFTEAGADAIARIVAAEVKEKRLAISKFVEL